MYRFSKSVRGESASVALVVLMMVVVAIVVAGCSSGTASNSGSSTTGSAPANGMQASSTNASAPADPSVQVCGECSGKGMGKMVAGKAVVKDGVQVVAIQIINGYYVPNKITAKAGMPIQIDFAGKSKGCVSKPKFPSLSQSADLSKTGVATMDLGTLKPGVYKFTCAMGMNAGSITVQ